MRVIAFLFFAAIMQVSASTNAQKLTYVQKNASLEQLFKEIKKQTGYNIVWYEGKLNPEWSVNANFRKTPLKDVMNIALTGMQLDYTISNKTVVIKEKEMSLMDKLNAAFSNIVVRGRVVDETGAGLQGASVKVKNTNKVTITDVDGHFTLNGVPEKSTLVISYLGYETKEVEASEKMGTLQLLSGAGKLNEVEVVSTGYQDIPKERATGSFVQIDNSLLNRRVSMNILDRLDGITSGLIFTKNANLGGAPQSSIEIRGRSTLFSNAEPLVILDNFPYDGSLDNINPNDVESITILKDAAAASVWGSRSGNGVIVITTKKGKLNSAPKINFNANVNIEEKPDLYYQPRLSSDQYIEVEDFLYDQGAFNSIINNGYSALSPAVEIFLAKRNGISDADSLSRINLLKTYDSREQELKYLYRPSVSQQYQANISGGGPNQKYFLSIGYDKNINSDVTRKNDRITLNANNTYYLLNNNLELNTAIIYTSANDKISGSRVGFLYPYSQIADEDGNALVVERDLRSSYANTAGNGKLLNWLYKPLEELTNNYSSTHSTLTDYRLNMSLSYKIIKELKIALYYNFGKGINDYSKLDKVESYYTRNEINKYSQIDAVTAMVINPLPVGGILATSYGNNKSQNGRFQIDYNYISDKHKIAALGGTEIREAIFSSNEGNIFYGYDQDNASNLNAAINTNIDYPFYYDNSSSSRFSFNPRQVETNNRFLSYFFNASYTYLDKYIATVSARRDESNIFGVSANQKGVPLWSTGLAWKLSREDFYLLNWLPDLKLRATFGYTGNVNNNISAYLTASSGQSTAYNAPGSIIVNPPNPSLRWERIKNLNLGLDFSSKNNRVSGSIDLWKKTGLDLIGKSPSAPQTGITLFTGNSANTITKGIDFQLNSININGDFKWMTTLLYNYQESKVTDYKVSNGTNYNVVFGNFNNPLKGFPFYALFSFKYAGLDSKGNPQGYLGGTPSVNYTGIINSTNREELVYNGSAVPTSFGSLRNTYTYKEFDFSFNITYKFGYYFRRNSLDNTQLYSSSPSFTKPDYEKRWKKPGDELTTNVPALIYPNDISRTSIYTFSEVLIEKGDHIRFQDLRLGYNIKQKPHLPFNNLNLFAYINNLGIVWRANKQNIDPDAVIGLPASRTIAFGIKVDM